MLMRYYINKNILPTLILSLAFLSGLFYLIETIVIIHKPINDSTLIQTKSNDISIFYLFRQLSFIFLTALALCCYSSNSIWRIIRKNMYSVAGTDTFYVFPFSGT